MRLIWVTADSLPSKTNSFLLPCTFYIKIIKTRSKIIKNLSSAQMSWIESWTTRCQTRQLKQQRAKVEVTVKPLITCWDCTKEESKPGESANSPCSVTPMEWRTGWGSGGWAQMWKSGDLSLLKKPQTKSSCRFMEWGWRGIRNREVWILSLVSFQVRRPPNRDTWARNAAMHKSMAG